MSYDIHLGVKVEGGKDLFAVIDEPQYGHPTYNIGEMFRACMDWDFEQGEWYKLSDVLPNIERGLHELRFNEHKYIPYNSPNGWGTTQSARTALESLLECIGNNLPGSSWGWNQIPLELLYMRW